MRLYYEPCDLEVELEEGGVTGICLESPAMFRSFAEKLWNQSNGADGDIFFTKGNKAINLQKAGNVIFNPYSVDVNDRKILAHIYGELQEAADLEYFQRKSEINALIVALLDDLEKKLPYPLDYSLEIDFLQLLKLYDVKIEAQDGALVDRLVCYIRLMHQVLGKELFIFIHLSDYFSGIELELLEEMMRYEQVAVLIVESKVDLEESGAHKWWIVDKDSCIIEI